MVLNTVLNKTSMTWCWQRVAMVLLLVVTASAGGGGGGGGGDSSCTKSDVRITNLKQTICASIGGCPAGNVTAHGDWPNQAVYMNNLLQELVDPATCLNTTVAKETIAWLDVTNTTTSPWWNTWVVFQVQYYDMPRIPGTRIETPATLGRKCWAFSYLRQIWATLRSKLEQSVSHAHLSLAPYIAAYDKAVPLTMGLCDKVMANCFVNASYDPSRNGTCPGKVLEFFVGFQWENGLRNDIVQYPFPKYDMNEEFIKDSTFAVNTALNYII